jgi:hypothetical protein
MANKKTIAIISLYLKKPELVVFERTEDTSKLVALNGTTWLVWYLS